MRIKKHIMLAGMIALVSLSSLATLSGCSSKQEPVPIEEPETPVDPYAAWPGIKTTGIVLKSGDGYYLAGQTFPEGIYAVFHESPAEGNYVYDTPTEFAGYASIQDMKKEIQDGSGKIFSYSIFSKDTDFQDGVYLAFENGNTVTLNGMSVRMYLIQ